jgi:predicted ATPase
MQLSDYFIALALSGKKVMVETHSDHIINRLVRRIVEDDTGRLKDLIGIYFISATDSGSVYEEVCIDENFGVTNWPVDFFDQTALEQEKILKAGLKKRQLARSSASKNEQEKQ